MRGNMPSGRENPGNPLFCKWIVDLAQFLFYDLLRVFGEVDKKCSSSP